MPLICPQGQQCPPHLPEVERHRASMHLPRVCRQPSRQVFPCCINRLHDRGRGASQEAREGQVENRRRAFGVEARSLGELNFREKRHRTASTFTGQEGGEPRRALFFRGRTVHASSVQGEWFMKHIAQHVPTEAGRTSPAFSAVSLFSAEYLLWSKYSICYY